MGAGAARPDVSVHHPGFAPLWRCGTVSSGMAARCDSADEALLFWGVARLAALSDSRVGRLRQTGGGDSGEGWADQGLEPPDFGSTREYFGLRSEEHTSELQSRE